MGNNNLKGCLTKARNFNSEPLIFNELKVVSGLSNTSSIQDKFGDSVVDLQNLILHLKQSLNFSILCGENLKFETEEDLEKFFKEFDDELVRIIENVKGTIDLIESKVEEFSKAEATFDSDSRDNWNNYITEIKKSHRFLINILNSSELYHDLIKYCFDEVTNIGNDKKTYNHTRISRIINFPKLERQLLDSDISDQEFTVIKLNLIISEFDFHLKCTNKYIADLVEVYKCLDYIEKSKLQDYTNTYYSVILKNKCEMLLKKAFFRRPDINGCFEFISLNDNRIKRIDVNSIVVKYYSTFSNLYASRYKYTSNFDIKEETFKLNEQEFRNKQEQGIIDFKSAHYLLKYIIKTTGPNLDEKLSAFVKINQLKANVDRIRDDFKIGKDKFDQTAFQSLDILLIKSKLKLLVKDIDNIDYYKLYDYEDRLYRIKLAYDEIKDWHNSNNYREDFYHHKLMVIAKIGLMNRYLHELDKYKSETDIYEKKDIKALENIYNHLFDMTKNGVQLFTDYQKSLYSAEKHNLLPLYLPFEQCIEEFEEKKFFLDSTYILCINYQKEKEDFRNYKNQVNNLWQDLQFRERDFYVQKSKATEKIILEEASKKTEKEISNNTIKSVQFLGIFSGVISLAVLTLGGIKDMKDSSLYLISLLGLATIFLFFTGFIGVMSLSFDNKADRNKLWYLGISTAIACSVFFFSYKNYLINPKSSFNVLHTSFDSLRNRIDIIDSLRINDSLEKTGNVSYKGSQ